MKPHLRLVGGSWRCALPGRWSLYVFGRTPDEAYAYWAHWYPERA